MAKVPRFLIASLISVLIGVSALSFVPARSSAAVYWTPYAGPTGPNEIYIDQSPTFTFYIHNDGSVGLDLWNFYVVFDWDTSTQYTLVGPTHVTITAGSDSTHYTLQVHVPQIAAAGTHTADIYCTGQASGDWLSTSGHWIFTFTVDTVPTLVVPSTGANPNSGTAPLTVNFNPTPSGGLSPYSYSWTFGDGATSTSAAPSHIYATAGTFTATVVVTDTETTGQVKSASATITVTWPTLAVTGTASSTSGTFPLSVDFTCTPSGGNGIYSYSWAFGDGGSSTIRNPTHEYTVAGTPTATVTVSDTASHTTQWSQVITVSTPVGGGPITLSGTASSTSGTSFQSVVFTCTPSGGNGAFSYSWDFGDGGTSTSQNPTHKYAAKGTYTVTVTVSDTASHTEQWSKVITVTSVADNTSSLTIMIIAAVVVVVAIIVALVAMNRKKKSGEKGSTPPVKQQSGPPQNP